MKTLKNTTIIAGIIVALVSLSAHATERKGGNKSASEKKTIIEEMGITKNLEIRLIEEYLQEQKAMNFVQEEKKIKIYDLNDQLVYEGDEENAVILKLSADFLMEYDNVSYYTLNK